ncbi:MAG: hypothetical protein ACYSW3_30825 [Planctomycetota bacterium]|jgi:hypothetical protein
MKPTLRAIVEAHKLLGHIRTEYLLRVPRDYQDLRDRLGVYIQTYDLLAALRFAERFDKK